jgi:hypothetical protein
MPPNVPQDTLAASFCDCAHDGWGNHECGHDDDAGAWCVEADTDPTVVENGLCAAYRYADACSVERFRSWR